MDLRSANPFHRMKELKEKYGIEMKEKVIT